jgi:hypothetical protein
MLSNGICACSSFAGFAGFDKPLCLAQGAGVDEYNVLVFRRGIEKVVHRRPHQIPNRTKPSINLGF